jgi:membrane protease YdiL (CAAX protease family)
MTPGALAAAGFEVAVAVAGAWALWAAVLAPAARARRTVRLAPWLLPPGDFACFLCFVFVGATLPGAGVGYLLRNAHLGSDTSLVLGGALMHVGILLGLVGFFRAFGARSNPSGPPVPAGQILRGGLVTFLIAMPLVDLASLGWGYGITRLGLPDDRQEMVQILENSQSKLLVGSLVAVATLLVPVTEEIIFRAGLFRFLRTRIPRWAAILVSAVVFGALHQSWSGFVPLTLLAVVFCLAYERTGSIGTTIVAHALFNLNTFVMIAAGISS